MDKEMMKTADPADWSDRLPGWVCSSNQGEKTCHNTDGFKITGSDVTKVAPIAS